MFTEEDPWNGKRSLETALPRRRSHNPGKVALKEFTGQKKEELVDKERRELVARNDPLPVCSPALYPSTVTCGDIVKVRSTATVISTAKTTVTTTLPTPTAFVTRTVSFSTLSSPDFADFVPGDLHFDQDSLRRGSRYNGELQHHFNSKRYSDYDQHRKSIHEENVALPLLTSSIEHTSGHSYHRRRRASTNLLRRLRRGQHAEQH